MDFMSKNVNHNILIQQHFIHNFPGYPQTSYNHPTSEEILLDLENTNNFHQVLNLDT